MGWSDGTGTSTNGSTSANAREAVSRRYGVARLKGPALAVAPANEPCNELVFTAGDERNENPNDLIPNLSWAWNTAPWNTA